MTPGDHVCWLVVGILGVWRVSHLVTAEDGPWGVLAAARRRAGHGVVGQLVDCFYCTSVWVAGVWVLAWPASWLDRLAVALALSGGAVLLERTTAGADAPPAASFIEGPPADQEDGDGVLRR